MLTDTFQLALDELETIKGIRMAALEDMDGTMYMDIVVVTKEEKTTRITGTTRTTRMAEKPEDRHGWPVLKGCLIAVAVCALIWTGIVIVFMCARGQ
jgi:hypothetical protein